MEDERIKYLARAYELMLPEGESEDFLGCSTLLFSGDGALGTEIPAELTADTQTRKQVENRTRAVIEGQVETVYGKFAGESMGFVRFDGDGEISFITDDFYPAYGSLRLRLRADAPVRIEVYNSDDSGDPFAVFDLPSTEGEWVIAAQEMGYRSYWQRMTYFRVKTEGRAELDWVEFSDDTSLPVAETEFSRTYKDDQWAYMYSGGQYVVAISSPEPYTVSCTAPMTESSGFVVLRPVETGGQSLYITVRRDGMLYCKCEHIWVFDDVDELIDKTTVNHRFGGDYTSGSMARYQMAAEKLREISPTDPAFVAAAEALRLADLENRLANLPTAPADGPILHYDFRRMSAGDKVADLSPYGNDGAVVGAIVGGGEARLSGGAYIRMPEGLLAGAEAATVSVAFKAETERTYAWLWCFANGSDSGYMFFGPHRPDGMAYGAITPNIYQNESSVSTGGITRGRVTVATVVHDGKNLLLYIDGVLVAKSAARFKPSELGSTAANYIGRSVFESDPAFEGSVYDFRVYNRALSGDEAALLPSGGEAVLTLESLERNGSVYAYRTKCSTEADIYAAAYGGDGTMLDVSVGPEGELETEGAAYLKFFAWEDGTLRPLEMVYVNIMLI